MLIEDDLLESHFTEVVESTMDAIWSETPDGRVTSWNPAAQRLFGYDREEMLGGSARRLVPADRASEYVEIRRAAGGQGIAHYDTQCVTRDGRILDLSIAVSPIRSAGDEIAGLSMVCRDVTDVKAGVRELTRTRAQLKAHAANLERSNADLEQFAYVVSHDLSEPLRAVAGFLQLLERRHGPALDDDARRYIRRSVDGAARMRALIDDLLAYSRAGRADIEAETVDCGLLVASVLEGLSQTLHESGAAVHVGDLPQVRGSSRQLGQIFQNLIANAAKFRRGPQPDISVRCERNDHHWRFSVLDDGIGIDSRYADRVFEVFKRLNGQRDYAGTGIGLAICKRIVEVHGGRIWCEPREGQDGTAFHFTLPASP